MLSGRIRRRALALLGALLLVILVWPPCCATMPKPLPAVLPMGPWEKVPPARPHPAAIAVPVQLPLQQHGSVAGAGTHATHLKRHGSSAPQPARDSQGKGAHEQQEREPPESQEHNSRNSRRESEFYRFMRVLNQRSVESNERRQLTAVSETVAAGQLNIPPCENSPPRPHDYLIESIDKNKPRTMRTVPAGDKDARVPEAQFDDTPGMTGPPAGTSPSAASSHPSAPPTVLARSRRNAAATPPPSATGTGNPHRHQHKLAPGGDQQLNGTAAGVWHGRRGGGGGGRQQQQLHRSIDPNLERNERAANLSHISGATRKIQLFIKNRYVQLLPDGTVNGTHDDLSDYTILQRTTVGIGQIKIQAVATCLFLCMDTCGSVYGSKEFSDDCIFNEQMEQHHYNTYSSTQHSNSRRTLYLALNKTGQPRKIQIPVNRTLGKLATYTKALTQTVAHERVEQLVSRLFGADHVRHGLSQLCETGQPLVELTAKEMRPRPVCGGQGKGPLAAGGGGGGGGKKQQQNGGKDDGKEGPRQKKKKKRRKCREDEQPGEHCMRPGQGGAGGTNSSGNKKRPGGHQQQSGQPRQPGSSSISSNSTSSVGSSSSAGGTNQSATSLAGHLTNGSSISSSSSSSNSSANSLIASISSGGPNRQGLPYAQLTATPNVRKPKPTRKLPANGGPGGAGGTRAASQQTPGGATRKPKKPTQQPGTGSAGKRNGTNPNKPGPARSKLVSAGVVPPKSNPKPASLTVARPARPSLVPPFLVPSTSTTTTTTQKTTTTWVEASNSNARTTVSNALQQDTSQQSEDTELDMDDVLQQSAELADELDELDEGNLNLAGHALNFVDEDDLYDMEF